MRIWFVVYVTACVRSGEPMGAFESEADAVEWAKERCKGLDWEIRPARVIIDDALVVKESDKHEKVLP